MPLFPILFSPRYDVKFPISLIDQGTIFALIPESGFTSQYVWKDSLHRKPEPPQNVLHGIRPVFSFHNEKFAPRGSGWRHTIWFRFGNPNVLCGVTSFNYYVEEILDMTKWLIPDWGEFSDSSQSSIRWSAKWLARGFSGMALIVLAVGIIMTVRDRRARGVQQERN
jgi:hypothetical protein